MNTEMQTRSPPEKQQPEARRAAVIGIDWGTTHRRIVALDDHGRVLATAVDDEGMLLSSGRFPAAFEQALALMPPADGARVFMSGMVGSAQGWHQVPYLDTAVPLGSLGDHLFAVPDAPAGMDLRIVPGYLWNAADGCVEVMRGEETQLLGAWAMGGTGAADGVFILPGTHSKWVRVSKGRIESFATYMSGELFALMSQQGTLASLMRESGDDEEAFVAGLQMARSGALANALFQCRAQVVAARMPTSSAKDCLSGVLIGAEWHDAMSRFDIADGPVRIIGTPNLSMLHARAARRLGMAIESLDADAVQQAAWRHLCLRN